MRKRISGNFLFLAQAFGLLAAGAFLAVGDAHAQSLPQLDFASYPPQLIWLVIAFIALYLLMSHGALPKIGTVLEERRDKIERNLSRAEALKTEAQAAEQAYETALSEARAEAATAVKTVRDAAATEASGRQNELGATLMARIQKAEAGISEAKDKALSDIHATATEAARAATKKLTGETPDDAVVLDAVNKALEGSRR